MSKILEQNKTNAQAFYDLMFNQCKRRAAIEQYGGEEYIQHNPHVTSSGQGTRIMQESIFSASTTGVKSSSTGMCCKSFRLRPKTTTVCFKGDPPAGTPGRVRLQQVI